MNISGQKKSLFRFKCCKKDLNNYCCITCNNIFHKSCWDRKNDMILIKNQKIYCSQECAGKKDLDEETISELNLKMEELLSEIQVKDSYIKNLKKNSESFENDAFESEQTYIREISEQKIVIKNLCVEHNKMTKKNNELEDELRDEINKLTIFQKEIDDLKHKNEFLEKHLRTLETERNEISEKLDMLQDNDMEVIHVETQIKDTVRIMHSDTHTDDIRILSDQHMAITDSIDTSNEVINPVTLNTNSTTLTNTNIHSRKGCLLTLHDGRNRDIFSKIGKECTANNISHLSFIKTGANFDKVTEDIRNLTRHHKKLDYVLISAGANDLESGRYPSFKYLTKMVRSCPNINFIFCSIPFTQKEKILNKKICRFNKTLKEFIERLKCYVQGDIFYLELNSKNGKIISPVLAAQKVSDIIDSVKICVNRNLVYVKVIDNSELGNFHATAKSVLIT